MADRVTIPPGERGVLEKNVFLTSAPYHLAQASTPKGTPSTPAAPAATGTPSQVSRPGLDSTFFREFEKKKLEYLKAAAVVTAADAAAILPVLSQTPPLVLNSALQQSQATLSASALKNLKIPEWAAITGLDAGTLMDAATTEANRWIDATLLKLPPNVASLSTCVDAAVSTHFNATSPSKKALAIAAAVKHLTGAKNDPYGINSTKSIYGIGGYGCTELLFGKSYGYTRKYQSTHTQFCPDLWTNVFGDYPTLTAITRTIIHEALHRLHLQWGDQGIIDDDPGAYSQLSVAKTTTNPDTFAMFAMEAAKCP